MDELDNIVETEKQDKKPTLYSELFSFLIGFIGFQLISLFFSFLITLFTKQDNAFTLMLINVLSYLSVIIILLIVLFPFRRYFFLIFKKYQNILIGLLAGIVFIVLDFLLSYLLALLFPSSSTGENQSVAEQIILSYPVISILLFGILGPVVEELTYRFGCFNLLNRVHKILAYIVSILIFAVLHINFFSNDLLSELVALPSYIFAGFAFAFIYDKWGLGASFVAHSLNNLYAVILILVTK